MFSCVLNLIKEKYDFDEIGNHISDKEKTEVFCKEKSVSRSEFYNASIAGLKPSIVFIVKLVDYNNETKVEYDNSIYNVIRTYKINSEEIELVCEKVIGNG